MSKPKPPAPAPRRQFYLPVKTEDDEPLKCSSTPQSPTNSSKRVPPPVLPKKWTVKKSSGRSETVNGSVEIVKMVVDQPVDNDCKAQPPPLPAKEPKEQLDDEYEALDTISLSDCYKEMTPWNTLCQDLKLRGSREKEIIKIKAEHLYKAIQSYILLISGSAGTLKQHLDDLRCIADKLDKVSKGTKIAGITGGATTVAGGVAAAAGVILSPFTLGASLALTVVGVGVATAGGVTGASAAIANKVSFTQDKKKIEKILHSYDRLNKDIEVCLKFIDEGMEQLKQHGLSVLSETSMSSERATKVVGLVATGGANAMALEANSKARGEIKGFALGMDFFFTQGKDGQKVKKGFESKFAKKIRSLADDLEKGLGELMKMNDLFSEL